MKNEISSAVLGGGCFWCIEALFQKVKGVTKLCSGYSGGQIKNPTYKQVKTGTTGHIQVVKVDFDPQIISYKDILYIFMHVHDPTQQDGQGEDIGTQYISAIFYQSPQQKEIAVSIIDKVQQQSSQKIVTKLIQLQKFYPAEQYHQNYYNIRGKQNPYCNIIPIKIKKLVHLFKDKTTQQSEIV